MNKINKCPLCGSINITIEPGGRMDPGEKEGELIRCFACRSRMNIYFGEWDSKDEIEHIETDDRNCPVCHCNVSERHELCGGCKRRSIKLT